MFPTNVAEMGSGDFFIPIVKNKRYETKKTFETEEERLEYIKKIEEEKLLEEQKKLEEDAAVTLQIRKTKKCLFKVGNKLFLQN